MATSAAETMTAEDWDAEAADMVEEVIKTQKDVADLLREHSQATGELEELKNACTQELEELQTGTWKLQLYAELEKMRGQLHHLAPLAADKAAHSCDSPDTAAAAAAQPADGEDLAEAAAVSTASSPCPDSDQDPPQPLGSDGSSEKTTEKQQQDEDNDLQSLDDEIAAVNRQLEEAKSEMASMMLMKRALEEEIAGSLVCVE